MKRNLFLSVTYAILILCAFSCLNKKDVLKEISVYHACISICQDISDRARDSVNALCSSPCELEYNTKYYNCIYHNLIQHHDSIFFESCIRHASNDKADCLKERCKPKLDKINDELVKCKQACAPRLSNPN